MNIAEFCIRKKTFFIFISVVLAVSGVVSYFKMGKLEDPEFTIKTAIVVTPYAGASPLQVEEEVSEKIEKAVQKLDRLKYVQTESRAGLSVAHVHLQENVPSRDVPQEWDHLRRRISDVQADLPPGAGPSVVKDDFGDVFGVIVALTGPGYSYEELRNQADLIQKELLLVDQVSRVELWGEQTECVYVDISRSRLAKMGIPLGRVLALLEQQNMVTDAGSADLGRERVRFALRGEFSQVEDIGSVVLGGIDPVSGQEQTILLRDVASISQGILEPPTNMMRFNGQQALGIAISTVKGGNVIEMGRGVTKKLEDIKEMLPPGIETHYLAFEPDQVDQAINSFMLNLMQAVSIVVVLLLLFMGFRSGLIIGKGLVLTILITFALMRYLGMDLDRVSLGALIIALGMLVDNAIVITEGMLVKMQTGIKKMEAARQTVKETAWPLLGATLVAIFAFMPIVLAGDDTGEYTRGLFLVIAVSLLTSWFLAMTVTPLWGYMFLGKDLDEKGGNKDPHSAKVFGMYRSLLDWSMNKKILVLSVMGGLFVISLAGFTQVNKSFFPPSTRPQLKLDYWLPEGSRIESLSKDMARIEEKLLEHPNVVSVGSFIGEGAPRFYLPMEPRFPNRSFGQMIINIDDASNLDRVREFSQGYLAQDFAYAEPRVRKFPMGPPVEFSVEVRFSGHDREVLRSLADRAKQILKADPDSREVRDDWRQMVKIQTLEYSQARGIRAGVDRQDVARALKLNFDGISIGMYREGDKLMPIILRPPLEQRQRLEDIYSVDVRPLGAERGVPLGQAVVGGSLEWEDSIIIRRDRLRTITVQAETASGTAQDMMSRIRNEMEMMELPPGYRMEWGGEYEKSRDSQAEVFAGVPISFMLMAIVVAGLFSTLKQPLIITMVLPLAMIGITAGLLLTGQPFGFLALLGALSLSGMLIKNVVVLIDQIDMYIESGKERYQALMDASVSRLRPVMMATLSTVMGMTPLLFDDFWVSMAITIVFGLTFATVLTLVVAPILYSILFRIKAPGQ
ncbi:efflux RND transporter permease subunit [Desulfonatronovibrio hydrogenovorans]|uniref:efflux RND transporter permease subunit n=1 Tax=Desulfonatronovibrio hydrogenovorans TaxID=53245 RepID=UPI00049072D8|nr:efflux RND transporter permease subunit [Desulfonatronovibrio hydrogenovorans]